jgi:RND family efflux transporter MFP subunit
MKNALTWLITITMLSTAACDRGEPGEITDIERPLELTVSRPAASPELASFPATVQSTAEAELATRSSGAVRQVTVDVGSRVSRGQVLVVLDPQDVEARIAAAAAGERQARRYHGRIQALERDGAATGQELDDALARLEMAEAASQEAAAQRAYAVLTAPFAGVIVRRNVDPGDLAIPARPILTLVDPESIEVVVDLPGAHANRVAPGDTVLVVNPRTGTRHRATITRISPAQDARSHRVRLEAHFADSPGDLMPGSFVRVELSGQGGIATWIPADAVVRRGQLAGVFVLQEDVVRLRWIRLGLQRSAAVEVLAGLDGDARVVRSPAPHLTDGARVDRATETPFEGIEGGEPQLEVGL